MKYYPNILLVSGSSRNVGKTAFICIALKQFSNTYPIISIKISPHFHKTTDHLIFLKDTEQCKITIETSTFSNKDTSKYLQAGTLKSFFIQCQDSEVVNAFDFVVSKYQKNQLFIVESGNLKDHIKPGVSIFITNSNKDDIIKKNYSDNDIYLSKGYNFADYLLNKITIIENQWKLLTN